MTTRWRAGQFSVPRPGLGGARTAVPTWYESRHGSHRELAGDVRPELLRLQRRSLAECRSLLVLYPGHPPRNRWDRARLALHARCQRELECALGLPARYRLGGHPAQGGPAPPILPGVRVRVVVPFSRRVPRVPLRPRRHEVPGPGTRPRAVPRHPHEPHRAFHGHRPHGPHLILLCLEARLREAPRDLPGDAAHLALRLGERRGHLLHASRKRAGGPVRTRSCGAAHFTRAISRFESVYPGPAFRWHGTRHWRSPPWPPP